MRNLGEKQRLVLEALRQASGKATVGELAGMTGMSSQSVSQALIRLAARGLVRRVARGVYEIIDTGWRI